MLMCLSILSSKKVSGRSSARAKMRISDCASVLMAAKYSR